ncbi:hypothetical protein PHJA_002442400 [Phtheirospermum japonicum]|uniref:Uncharacterized protein n=1 Tax=Phtheirospermum japonicum TaxID=374723 RepID=A0A830D779_9LAMI|nr:hypothetical protein PHJA_002442400 [Phtheirospermum japonicum]
MYPKMYEIQCTGNVTSIDIPRPLSDLVKEHNLLKEKEKRLMALCKERGVELKRTKAELLASREGEKEARVEISNQVDATLVRRRAGGRTEFLNSKDGLRLIRTTREATKHAFLESMDLYKLLMSEALLGAPEFPEHVLKLFHAPVPSPSSHPDQSVMLVLPASIPSPFFAGLGELLGGTSPSDLPEEDAVEQLARDLDTQE